VHILVHQLAVSAGLLLPAPAHCPRPPVPASQTAVEGARTSVLCRLNHERAQRGLAPLRENRRLEAGAGRYARRMVEGRFFAHDRRGMTRRIRRTGYLRHRRYWNIGENLGWGSGTVGAPAGMVRAWMRSVPHRRNILDGSFRRIGIGVVVGVPIAGLRGATYVTDFG
jgi:uncharacterized protein YkwD